MLLKFGYFLLGAFLWATFFLKKVAYLTELVYIIFIFLLLINIIFFAKIRDYFVYHLCCCLHRILACLSASQ